MMKNLPIGIQSFEDLRKRNYLYIDKTEAVLRMISSGKIYFLSRPRRFGKSLLVNTLEAVFKGQKELFEGLYIYDKWDWNEKCPVIHLDFGARSHRTLKQLESSLFTFVNAVAKNYSVNLVSPDLPDRFAELIEELHKSTGQQVVVLIDEYDKPISDNLSNPEVRDDNKTTLHDFYQVLKATDNHLRFIFLTGVSKFSGLSVFSALNNPDDITLNKKYASICGYTQEELETFFSKRIDEVAQYQNKSRQDLLADIKKWYDGYSWDAETSVYNPFSTLEFFNNEHFSDYWFRTGTPTFLIELLKSRNQISPVLKPVEVGEKVLDGYDPETLNEIPLLFQTGYLTVKSIRTDSNSKRIFTLDIPNSEVRDAFMEDLLSAYTACRSDQIQLLIPKMQKQIYSGDTSGLEKNLRMLLANIPTSPPALSTREGAVENEAYYHSIFSVWMNMLGFEPQDEVETNIGRIDTVLHHADLTIVAEIKYSSEKTADRLLNEAMKQIHKRKYYEKYADRKVILMGVAFAGKEVKCKLEEIRN